MDIDMDVDIDMGGEGRGLFWVLVHAKFVHLCVFRPGADRTAAPQGSTATTL